MRTMKKSETFLSSCVAWALVAALAAGARADTAGPERATDPNADPSKNKALQIRRVIAVSAAGGSQVLADNPMPVNVNPKTGVGGAILWSTSVKPRIGIGAGAVEQDQSFPPPPGEARFILLDVAPGAVIDMHATDTIDQFVVIEGEIELYLEQGPPTTLGVGDTVVLLGARHKWVNRTSKVAKGILTAIGVAR